MSKTPYGFTDEELINAIIRAAKRTAGSMTRCGPVGGGDDEELRDLKAILLERMERLRERRHSEFGHPRLGSAYDLPELAKIRNRR